MIKIRGLFEMNINLCHSCFTASAWFAALKKRMENRIQSILNGEMIEILTFLSEKFASWINILNGKKISSGKNLLAEN